MRRPERGDSPRFALARLADGMIFAKARGDIIVGLSISEYR